MCAMDITGSSVKPRHILTDLFGLHDSLWTSTGGRACISGSMREGDLL